MTGSQPHVLVIGTGRMARVRVPRLVRAGLRVTLTGHDAVRTAAVASELGVIGRARADLRSGFQTGAYEAVVVTSASEQHHRDLGDVLPVAPVVMCEKPVATTTEAARELRAEVERVGAEVFVGFQRRFDPEVAGLREQIRRGDLGELLHLRATDFDHVPGAREFIATSGGMFRDLLIHDLDWLAWTTGQRIATVHAFGSVRVCEDYRDLGDCDVATVAVVLADGTLGTLTSSRVHPSGQDVRMEVLGSKQAVSVGLTAHTPLQAVGTDVGTLPPPDSFMERFATAFELETDAFARYVTGEADHFEGCTLEEAVSALEAAEACQTSWTDGVRVDLHQARPSSSEGGSSSSAPFDARPLR